MTGKWKKLALILALLMVCLCSVPALAAGSSVTVKNIAFNQLPGTEDGLTVLEINVSGRRAVLDIRNDSGSTVGRYTYIEYRCYGSGDLVLDNRSFYLNHMNPGETCRTTLWFPGGTKRLEFGRIRWDDGSETADPSEIATATVRNMNFNIPYEREGVSVNVTDVSGRRFTVQVTKNTDIPLSSHSYIAYKCYSKDGEVLEDGQMYLEDLNPGETCTKKVWAASKTKTLLFGEVSLKEGTLTERVETQKIGKVEVNLLPIDLDGVTVTDVRFNGRKTTLTLRNDTGMAVSRSSRFSYKCYNVNDEVVDTGTCYMEDMNPGDTCSVYFYMGKKTVRLLIDSPEIKEGTIIERPATAQYGKFECNSVPYASNGLTITDIQVKGRNVTITVRNDTGKNISGAHFDYRVLNKEGKVMNTSSAYLPDMNAGESCRETVSLYGKVSQLIFGEADYYEMRKPADLSASTAKNGKIIMNIIPYESNGLAIISASASNTKIKMVIRNNTGSALTYSAYIPYRCYDADGYVTRSNSVYVEAMGTGESCKATAYIPKGTYKVIFGEAVVR